MRTTATLAMALECRVSGVGGMLCEVCLDAGATVTELQSAIATSTGIPVSHQRLFHGSQELRQGGGIPHVGGERVEVLLVRRTAEQVHWLQRLAARPHCLVWAAKELQADRELVICAVTREGTMLDWAANELRADKEVVMAAVGQNGKALRFASKRLQADRELVISAVTREGTMLNWAANELRADKEVVM